MSPTGQAADNVRRSTLLDGDLPPWGAAPTPPPPTPDAQTTTTTVLQAAPVAPADIPRRAPRGQENLLARARVDASNAALAWIKAELRTESKLAELRERVESALAIGVPRDVLLGVVVDACKRHGGSPGLLSDELLAVLGVARGDE